MTGTRLDHLRRLQACNSLDFLERAFAFYDESVPFCVEREATAHPAVSLLASPDIVAVRPRFGWGSFGHTPAAGDAIAQIVFTSGTEGRPKAIAITHGNLADVVDRLNRSMAVDDGIREYIGVPVTYSFGLGRARAVSAAGGSVFIPERFDPAEIGRMAAAGDINAVSAVPALWRLILANPDAIGAAGARIRWIEIGSQAMSAAEKIALRRLFPEARIVQHYGLTEASRTTFLQVDSAPEEVLGSVGAPTGAVEVAIGGDGSIRIRGPHVAAGTLADDGTIVKLTDDEGWLVTKDQGRLDGGFLWYEGRLDDQINVAGLKIGAEALEERIRELVNTAPGSFAVGAGSDPLRGEIVLLATVPGLGAPAALIAEAARIALTERGLAAEGVLRTVEAGALPVTETGKIRRRALAELADVAKDRVPKDAAPDEDALDPGQARIAAAWRRVVGDVPINPGDSFYDLGGDSLSAIQIGLTMEAEGYPNATVKGTLEGRSLAELAAQSPAAAPAGLPDLTVRGWSLNLVRGLMVLSVLMSHWGPGVFARLGLEEVTNRFLAPVYRMGTPGFAMVFGIGLGFFLFPNVLRRPAVVRNRLRQSFLLVAAAVMLLALTNGVHLMLVKGALPSAEQTAVLFYGVLTFYAVALVAAFPVLQWIARAKQPYAACLAGTLALWFLYVFLKPLLPPGSLGSPLELLKLLAVQHYSIPRIGGIVLLGCAVGIWYARQPDLRTASAAATGAGAGVAMLALLIGSEPTGFAALADRVGPFYGSIASYVFYGAAVVALLGLAMRIVLRWEERRSPVRLALKGLIVFGALALPVYAFHGMVIPVADILHTSGLPRSVAIAIPMGLFLAGIGWLGFRVWTMYFGGSDPSFERENGD